MILTINNVSKQYAAHKAYADRLDQKLQEDGATPRPKRFPDTDLRRSLRNGDKHNIHDPDPADEERQPRDEESGRRDHTGNPPKLA